MDWKTIAIFGIPVFIIGFGLAWWLRPAEVIYQTNAQQRQIDSLSVVVDNARSTNDAIADSLENTTEAFRDYVTESENRIASLTRINGRLNLAVDSIQSESPTDPVSVTGLMASLDNSQVFKDTTITYFKVFGDSLMKAGSQIVFKGDTLSNEISLNQLRDIRLDLAILVSPDRRHVESIATSPDFESLNISAQTALRPPRRRIGWPVVMALGFLGGVVVTVAL